MHVAFVDDARDEAEWRVERYSQHMACDRCGRSFEPLNPHHFSFNSPLGWCPTCEGLGFQRGASTALLIRDAKRSLRNGAIAAWPELDAGSPFTAFAEALARHIGFSLDTTYEKLSACATAADSARHRRRMDSAASETVCLVFREFPVQGTISSHRRGGPCQFRLSQ